MLAFFGIGPLELLILSVIVGIPVLSKSEDIANVRLKFANGCVANLTASRVSVERMRKIRVFSGPANDPVITTTVVSVASKAAASPQNQMSPSGVAKDRCSTCGFDLR